MISTKEYVISKLLRADGYISGEALSTELKISRAAVNTAVKALRDDGYAIKSVTNKGYRLINSPDILSFGEINALLPDRENVIVLPEVDSTNKHLKDLAYNGTPDRTVVISDCQTAGRGRLGRSFHSPSGSGIYLSYLMRPTVAPQLISTITCWSAVAVTNAIKNVFNTDSSIKWVNDILINDMKICGILTEMSIEPEIGAVSVVIGIGINVNEAPVDFPPEIRNIASSIRYETRSPEPLHRADLAAELIKELDKMYSSFPDAQHEYIEAYRKNCSTVGLDLNVVSAHNHTSEIPRPGIATGIGDDFSLIVRFEDGHEENLSSGEVSVIRK